MKSYDHKKIESKWQKEWNKKKVYKTEDHSKKPKYYVLDMFPYPSGEGLHVGHPKGYIATDIISRMKRMQGSNVLHPMGFDAFGLPAENYAIKTKTNPEVSVKKNVARYKKQLEILGFDYDWNREVNTTDPKFYKWTQWIFLKLLEKGLAYESNEPVNWCPKDKTVLANEDVEGGRCERCGTVVEKRPMRQWVLRITKYADRMLEDLKLLDWPESIKESQRNWIGRSEGMLFTAPVKDTKLKLQTFSAHFEAFAADTFVVIAPDHPFLKELVKGTEKEKEVLEFAGALVNKRNNQDFGDNKDPEGIFTGRYIIDPVGNGDLPIWVASYALAEYGTGIVKCSAHDERDFAFAKKYNLKLKPVLFPEDLEMRKRVENLEICYVDMKKGVLSEPKEFKGRVAGEVRDEIKQYLEKHKLAERKVSYRLKDWVFSRQRYWGEPIPVLKDPETGEVIAVPEKELPVKLPKVKNYEPTGTGESPLANIKNWVEVKKDGKVWKRETNTMPQWAGSSWYYLRYMDPKNSKKLVDPKLEKYWNQVDFYVGGAEHAARHLIYARFWHKFLYDLGAVSTLEPFKKLQSVGLIMGPDGRKMSKRFGNVINPDDIVKTWGADSLRLYEMFMGPFADAIAWNTDNMIGVRRFLERVWKQQFKISKLVSRNSKFESLLHKTIKKVTEDISDMKFNTAISSMMILINEVEGEESISKDQFGIILQLLAPFAPHITEELWNNLGNKKSIHLSEWPRFDEKKIVADKLKIAVQINGKVRGIIDVESGAKEEEVKNMAQNMPEIAKWLEGQEIKKMIYVPGKILNLVV